MRTGRFDLFQYELPSGNAKRLSGPDILNQTRFGNVITHNIHLSQDGKHLVFEANLPNEPLDLDQFEGANVLRVHLWHMDLATGKTRRFDTDTGYVGYPHQGWSPDGRFYVARRQEGFNDPGGIQPKFSWLMWDTRTWRQVPITKRLSREKEGWLRPFYGYEPYVSTSPDGTRAASVRLVGMGEKAAWTVQVKETSDGRTGYSIHVPRAQTPVFWTRDGKRLVFLSQLIREPPVRTTTWFLYVYDAKTGKRLHQQKLADRSDLWDYFLIPHWSRDGRWLISLSRERDGYDVILWNAATYDVRVLPGPRRLPSVISTTDWVSGIDWAELPSS